MVLGLVMKQILLHVFLLVTFMLNAKPGEAFSQTKFSSSNDYFTVFPTPPRTVKKLAFEYDASAIMQEKIRYQVNYFASLEHVPYVWGGGTFENVKRSACDKCKACIRTKKIPIKEQYLKCSSCRKCGIDCSHLVVSLYNKTGLSVPYGSTGEFNRFSESILNKYYSLIDVGTDVSRATTGDLILYDSHIVLLVENHGDGKGDILHAQDLSSIGEIGGIMFQRKRKITRISGQPIRKILRHKRMSMTLKKPIFPSTIVGLDYLLSDNTSRD